MEVRFAPEEGDGASEQSSDGSVGCERGVSDASVNAGEGGNEDSAGEVGLFL